MSAEDRTPPGLTVREATAEDNDALISLELESPLLVGDIEETFDRSPAFFACHRVKPDCRIVLAEMEGRAVGVMAGVIQTPVIQGDRPVSSTSSRPVSIPASTAVAWPGTSRTTSSPGREQEGRKGRTT